MRTKLLELLNKYQKNQATPEEIAYIKEKLAEFQALQDLSLEQEEEWPKLDWLAEDETFKQKVNQQIQKKWLKTVLLITTILLMLIGGGYFILPKAVAQFYYKPMQDTDRSISPFALSLVVAYELQNPYVGLQEVKIDDQGYGRYAIQASTCFFGQASFDVQPIQLQINRGNLSTFNGIQPKTSAHLLRLTSDSGLIAAQRKMKDNMLQQLATLPPYSQVYASLAFEPSVSLAHIQKLIQNQLTNTDIYWYGIQPPNNQTSLLGFRAYGVEPYVFSLEENQRSYLKKLNRKYPYLFNALYNGETRSEDYLSQHFQSMLQFMLDHQKDYQDIFKQSQLNREIKAYQKMLSEEKNFPISSVYLATTVEELKKILTADANCFAEIEQTELYNTNYNFYSQNVTKKTIIVNG